MRPDWPAWLWGLYAFAALYFTLFAVYFFRFRALERAADGGGVREAARYNRAIRGFPAGFYAKMLGYAPRGQASSDAPARET